MTQAASNALAEAMAARFDFVHGGATYAQATVADILAWGVPDAAVLPTLKDFLGKRVDDAAEALRLTIITPGAGQAMEYQEVIAQAAAALANPSGASSSAYPMLAASVGIDTDPSTKQPATDVLGVARSVQAAQVAWNAAGAAIRGARLEGKKQVDAAASCADALAAFAAIAWPTLA